MLLYKQMSADWLLIDDKRGRKIAAVNHINTIGSLGVLLSAKKRGLISAVKPKIDQIADSNVYIGQTLRQIVLDIAGE
jgi:predicted nucleic acid-binding protein